jgi:transcriptional regulator with XRE-family HTH domain
VVVKNLRESFLGLLLKFYHNHPKGFGRERGEKNISQSELADLIGMHSTHISRYERDLTQPTLEVIKKIAEALSVSTDALIYGSSDQQAKNKIKDTELLTMFNKVQSLEDKDISVIKSLISAYILKTDLQKNLNG